MSAKGSWLATALLVAAAVPLFAPLAGAPWLFDDQSVIVNNLRLQSEHPLNDWWLEPHPVRYLSLVAERACFGLNPLAGHGINLLLHAASTLLLAALLLRLELPTLQRSFGIAFFLLHPLAVEVLGVVSHRKDLLASCFGLAALLATGARGRWRWSAPPLLLLAILSKETAVVYFGLACLLAWWQQTLRTRARRLLLLGITAAASLGLAMALVHMRERQLVQERPVRESANHVIPGDPAMETCLTLGNSFGRYLAHYSLPLQKCLDPKIKRVVSLTQPRAWLALAGVAAFLALTIYGLRRRALWAFGLAWVAIALSPVLFPPLLYLKGVFLYADRYAYLGLAGAALFVAAAARHRLLRWILLLAVVALAARTALRVREYRSARTFWEATLACNPTSLWANSKLAVLHTEANEPEAARAYFLRALNVTEPFDPFDLDLARYDITTAAVNFGGLLLQTGETDQARRVFRAVTLRRPNHPNAHNYLALLEQEAHDFTAATEHLIVALQHAPENAKAWHNLGFCYRRMGRLDEAAEAYNRALRLPRHPESTGPELAATLLRLERGDHARNLVAQGLREAESDAERTAWQLQQAAVHLFFLELEQADASLQPLKGPEADAARTLLQRWRGELPLVEPTPVVNADRLLVLGSVDASALPEALRWNESWPTAQTPGEWLSKLDRTLALLRPANVMLGYDPGKPSNMTPSARLRFYGQVILHCRGQGATVLLHGPNLPGALRTLALSPTE